ncbi:gephyrin-like molybdotransferase Glp [Taklimakanibacter albus]|uniref:Molybdopterin molybdotransferase MoeA n=1 Tax=Taklimakanibacter albus TaxID=2800327 RepID=A0ACC5R1H0_9HYPH|nr:gephyrin-like molybdotransferase Glp [Aestuariivirga sp. YIM B02566]MBK1866474.1 molybdopterin molybdotransferase MoeA [Aestuariivirga sp. YIM B02566]
MALMPVAEAKDRILKDAKALPRENVPLHHCAGRVLAAGIKAKRDQPPFPASAMDGYAVRFADVQAVPARLKVIGTAPAGHGFGGTVKAGQAVRIFTGAPVPEGADTVVIQENTEAADGQVAVTVAAQRAGQHIRRKGLDFAKGEELLPRGTLLGAREIGLAAAMNWPDLPVTKRPKVAIFTTGDELVSPGTTPRPDQIVSSNSFALSAFVRRYGGEAVDLGIIPDNLKAISRAVRKASGAEILLTTGGASVGDHDLVQAALKAEGIALDFWKIALRPGKPLMFARNGTQRILGLPGNPVSALVCSRIFLKPLLSALLGLPPAEDVVKARLGSDLPANDQRQDYLRATVARGGDGSFEATPFKLQDSSMQRALTQAHGLIVRPPFAPAVRAGDLVDLLLLDF